MRHAPVFTVVYDLHSWLLDRLTDAGSHERVCVGVMGLSEGLLNSVVLALCHFDTEEQVVEADRHVALLRVHLRLAAEKGLLDDQQLMHANGLLRDAGRQLGGWRKHLESPDGYLESPERVEIE